MDAYSSGHLVMSNWDLHLSSAWDHSFLNLSCPRTLNFESPSVLLFCFEFKAEDKVCNAGTLLRPTLALSPLLCLSDWRTIFHDGLIWSFSSLSCFKYQSSPSEQVQFSFHLIHDGRMSGKLNTSIVTDSVGVSDLTWLSTHLCIIF